MASARCRIYAWLPESGAGMGSSQIETGLENSGDDRVQALASHSNQVRSASDLSESLKLNL